jgi:hypothetical protein
LIKDDDPDRKSDEIDHLENEEENQKSEPSFSLSQ